MQNLLDPNIPPSFVVDTLSQFGIHSARPVAGGLSGARVWRCASNVHGWLCLRRWSPTHPTPARLKFIHDAVQYATDRIPFLPRILRDNVGNSFWSIDGCLWELTQWMPGEADYMSRPSGAKLDSAIDSVAKLHAIWFDYLHECSLSPAVQQRISMLGEWLAKRDLVERIGTALRGPIEAAACMSTIKLLHSRGPQLLDELQRVSKDSVRLQPVLRDLWSDHLLFEHEQLSGIIDFGAMRMDEPASDLARMLGSLHPFEFDKRVAAIERYNMKRPSHPVSVSHVDLLDRSASLLTALQWLQWLVLERRKFSINNHKLLERWQTALSRMMGEDLLLSNL